MGTVDQHGLAPRRRELGFLAGGRKRRGHGFGTAMARAGLHHGFNVLGFDEGWAEAAATTASLRILRQIGLTETGRSEPTVQAGIPTYYRQLAVRRPLG